MFISELHIKNYRIFTDKTIEFNERLNVIIGPNSCGKTTLLSALQILFDSSKSRKLNIDDFNKNIDLDELKKHSPQISISVTISQSKNQTEFTDEVIPIATWLTKIKPPFEAKLTYRFFLPERHEQHYKDLISDLEINDYEGYWSFLEEYFIDKYVYKLFIGDEKLKNLVDRDDLSKFDFQFLSALRDVEKDLLSGKKSLLKEILDFFTDYDVPNSDLSEFEQEKTIKQNKAEFAKISDELYSNLYGRLSVGKNEILEYIKGMGAMFDNSNPDFKAIFTEKEAYEHLFLISQDGDITLPIELNGLGYNNLVYMALLLAKIQKDSKTEKYGDNAKFYSVLAIEEPEAHLHPNMQYKFLKFLQENQKDEVNQIFITSHSPNITAAVKLDNLIVLDKNNRDIDVYYPSKAFNGDLNLKNYVERFLDVTKSDMFFAKKLIFVEGLAEQLLIPEFVRLMGKDLSDYHISVISVNGRTFRPFLELFNPDTGIKKDIVCITDRDCTHNGKRCFSYEVDLEDESYEICSNKTVSEYVGKYDNIQVYTQEYGHTFEYELMFTNPKCINLIMGPMSNKKDIKNMIHSFIGDEEDFNNIFSFVKNNERKSLFENNILHNDDLEDSEKSKHIISTMYVKSIKSKGEYAQELLNVIFEMDDNHITVPHYIEEGLKWIMGLKH